jgi:hypothetical protein
MGGEAFADVRPGWQTESIMEEWAKYAQSQMSALQIATIYMTILNICSQAQMHQMLQLYRLHRGRRKSPWNLS